MAYAVIKTGGRQYRVATGDVIEIEKLVVEAGEATTFSEVLLVSDDAGLRVGTETAGATVSAEVVAQFKGPKLIAYKYRRRKGYHRTVGHRQRYTRVKITGINA
jgi:large subunit ribosomal protein L21